LRSPAGEAPSGRRCNARFCRLAWLSLVASTCFARAADAGEPWIAPGNERIRHDIQMLVDDGVLDLPVSAWPISVSDLDAALDRADAESQGTAAAPRRTVAQQLAFERLRTIAAEGRPSWGVDVSAAANPTALRTFADTPREEGELSAWTSGFLGNRWGLRLEVTGAANADDDRPVRIDGSYFAGKFGNWIVTLGAQDRWWGSGYEGSLILSNNARPVPAISLDRAVSKPFETKWLSWIGPWRLTTFMGRMEGDRNDFPHPLLFGFRVSARPLDGLEISVDRTAQWCGDGRSCSWSDFWNLWTGHDNAGDNVSSQDEPGNQLAGWDIRWASPVGDWPYALYNEHTGETIDNKIPRPYRSMDIFGVETWGGDPSSGSSWRAGLEFANTRCGGTQNGEPVWDCAYNNSIFTDGYRRYGRPIGHAMDGDGEMYSLRYIRVPASGTLWTALARYTKINRGGDEPDTRHSIAPGPEDWWSIDLSHRREFSFGDVDVGIGADALDRKWNDTDEVEVRAYLTWRHEF
jgi:hypothetical protein